jgi:hypothetical protein
VGNIPFDATEQQLIEVMQTAGPVVLFKCVAARRRTRARNRGV